MGHLARASCVEAASVFIPNAVPVACLDGSDASWWICRENSFRDVQSFQCDKLPRAPLFASG